MHVRSEIILVAYYMVLLFKLSFFVVSFEFSCMTALMQNKSENYSYEQHTDGTFQCECGPHHIYSYAKIDTEIYSKVDTKLFWFLRKPN